MVKNLIEPRVAVDQISARMEEYLHAIPVGRGFSTCDAATGLYAQAELCGVLGRQDLWTLICDGLEELDRLYDAAVCVCSLPLCDDNGNEVGCLSIMEG